jgi:putative lipoic acid-binding regulatory protein
LNVRELNHMEKQAGQGFQFPGSFQISALGNAGVNLRERVPEILRGLGMAVMNASVRERASRAGNYVSVNVVFNCPSRAKYDAAHAALRADPDIRYTL